MTDAPASWPNRTLVLPWRSADRGTRAMIQERLARGVAAGVFDARPRGLDPESTLCLLQQSTGALLGFATFYELTGSQLWLDLLWVEERHRRQGHATQLLRLVEEIAGKQRMKAIVLGRMHDNQAMAHVLADTGWSIDHVVHRKPVTT